MTTRALHHSSHRPDGHLWMTAIALSLLINSVIVIGVGSWIIQEDWVVEKLPVPTAAPESVVTIILEPAEPEASVAQLEKPRFARTTADQAAKPQQPTPFIGERDTRATSDRKPAADAPPLPSQAGIEPRDATDIETTESDYQDGALDLEETIPAPEPPGQVAESASPPPAPEVPATPTQPVERRADPPAPRDQLLEGPNPVDLPIPRETVAESDAPRPKPTDPEPAESNEPPAPNETANESEPEKPEEAPKPKPIPDPAFRGYQRKTAIVGSISRTGPSSLDVADSPLGRYQAAISRAVELEWQRNCVRHKDFITPGFLTVRFFVEPNGNVRSVEFIGEQLSGAIQKGFTHSSIRDAEIPPMPPALRREYSEEPLELQFRFYF